MAPKKAPKKGEEQSEGDTISDTTPAAVVSEMVSPSGCSSPFFGAFLGTITMRSPASCLVSEWRDSGMNKNANDAAAQGRRYILCFLGFL